MKTHLKYTIIAAPIVILAVVGLWCIFNTTSTASKYSFLQMTPIDARRAEKTSSNIEPEEITLPMSGWKQYSDPQRALDRKITFEYPFSWKDQGGSADGLFFMNTFEETDVKLREEILSGSKEFRSLEEMQSLVAYLIVEGTIPSFDDSNASSSIQKRYDIIVGGQKGEVIHQIVSLPDDKTREEWRAVFPDVVQKKDQQGHPLYTMAYEFYMNAVYKNSEEVFRKWIKSIKWGEALQE